MIVLAVCFLGVFITKGDVGVGTIVGSAVFNILVIIGICGIFSGQVHTPRSSSSIINAHGFFGLVFYANQNTRQLFESHTSTMEENLP